MNFSCFSAAFKNCKHGAHSAVLKTLFWMVGLHAAKIQALWRPMMTRRRLVGTTTQSEFDMLIQDG